METVTSAAKNLTISLPAELARKAEGLAERDGQTISELFLEAFNVYHAQRVRESLAEIGEYAATRNPHGYTEDDVPRLIKEVRVEAAAKARRDRTLGRVAV